MSNIKLFGLRGSTCTRRVLAVLEETGTPYEFYRVDWDGLEHKTPDWIATKQPFGRIPVLRDGEYQIYESRAIARYLASAYDNTNTLCPSDPKTRGMIEQWISVEQSYYVAAEDLVVQVIFTPLKGGEPDLNKVNDIENRLNHALGIIDAHLATSQFFVGDNFTVADIVFMPYTNMLFKIPKYVEFYGKYKSFMRWWQQVSTRPSWKSIAAQSEFNF